MTSFDLEVKTRHMPSLINCIIQSKSSKIKKNDEKEQTIGQRKTLHCASVSAGWDNLIIKPLNEKCA